MARIQEPRWVFGFKNPPTWYEERRGDVMRILLTGSRGSIGTVMAPLLVTEGRRVIGVDADFYRRSFYSRGQVPWEVWKGVKAAPNA